MKRGLYIAGCWMLAITGLLTALGFLAEHAFLFNTASHFRWQYAWMATVCLFMFGILRKFSLLSVALAIIVVNLLPIAPYYLPKTILLTSASSTKLLLMNVLSSNTNTAAVRAQIERFQSDLVILEEINTRWRAELADLSTKYPYHLHDIRNDNFGIWVLSKHPLIEESVVYWGPAQVPTIIFQYRMGDALVDVVATHPMSPGSSVGAAWRDEQLRAIAQHYENTPDPLIIIGDLNTTSFAPIFKDLVQQLDLKDSRRGFGLQNSWPAWAWNPFMISLDHCLVSQSLYVTRRELGDNIGSDHLPIYVEVALAR